MLSVQGATSGQQVPGVLCHISTHAPRAGSDSFVLLSRSRNFTFQSTLPVRGATETCAYTARYTAKFQSTLPVRGATGRWDLGMGRRYDFNPRSPCGERPLSITGARRTDPYFNPRSPCGERRSDGADLLHEGSISIHAPRAGSDLNRHCGYEMADDISIHAPRAGSDRPLLERTNIMAISIHAPRAGSDLLFECIIPREMSFQSTLPVRGATPFRWSCSGGSLDDFNPRSPCGERQTGKQAPALTLRFQSTLPVRGATAKMPKTEPFILSNFHNFKKNTDRTRTKVIIKMELWINLSPFSGANRTGNLWSLLLRTLKGS